MLRPGRHTQIGGACVKNLPGSARRARHHNAADYSPSVYVIARFVYKWLRCRELLQRRQLPNTNHWLVAMENTSKA